jgi:hypothetical protein
MNPYKAITAAGIPTDSHESDLYALATPEALAIVRASGWSFSFFRSNIDGRTWIDLPFAYSPWWEKRQPKTTEEATL